MVGILIRMNLAVQRKALSSTRIFLALVGLILALGTVALSLVRVDDTEITLDLLTSAFAAWTLLLAFAPVFGGSGSGIRPEHFALLPVSPRRLAIGLLGASLVGIGPVVALVAFTALVVYGFQLGVVPGLVGLIALPLQLILAILLSRVVYGVMGTAMQTRLGMEIVGFLFGLFFALVSSGWFAIQPFLIQTSRLLSEGWPPLLSTAFRVVPSGWGLLAVDAANRGDWGALAGILLVFIALIGLLLWVWTALLVRSTSSKPVSHAVRRSTASRYPALHRWLPQTGVGAVISKELRTWIRDPWRALELRVALWTSVLIVLLPVLSGRAELLPFVGLTIILMGGMVSGNLYGLDGSALWQTILTPGAARADVRGRQWAWLIIFVPVSFAATIIFTILSGHHWAWPLVLSLLFATLGATAGLILVFSVEFPSPGIDPHMRRNPMDSSGDLLVQIYLLPITAMIIAAPTLALVVKGLLDENLMLQWAGIPLGIMTGIVSAWGLGYVASRRLESKGPELVNLLLRGATAKTSAAEDQEAEEAWKELPLKQKLIVRFCMSLFWLPLFPQGVAPLIFKIAGVDAKSWFLALYLPSIYQWPVIFLMIIIGAAMLVIGLQIPRKHLQQRRKSRQM